MEKYKDVFILIPAYNPNDKLITYVNGLINKGVSNIIIVNDGSKKECENIFKILEQKPQCCILKHAINQGKGRALKTGFNYFLNNYNDKFGIVTADSDGQHSVKDTLEILETLIKNKNSVILGSRDFNDKNVPFKSKFGNKSTSLVYSILYGKKIIDTQTGLRGLPTNVIKKIITLEGERFEYEMSMLVYITRNKIDIISILIDTIYVNENEETHFKPLIDSMKIYFILFKMFFKFTIVSIFSAILDILLFTILVKFIITSNMHTKILYGTVLARAISSFINYFLNKNIVFENKDKKSKSSYLLKYYLLCVIQMFASWLLVKTFYDFTKGEEVIIKVLVDFFLFIVSFQIQNKFIFKKINKKGENE